MEWLFFEKVLILWSLERESGSKHRLSIWKKWRAFNGDDFKRGIHAKDHGGRPCQDTGRWTPNTSVLTSWSNGRIPPLKNIAKGLVDCSIAKPRSCQEEKKSALVVSLLREATNENQQSTSYSTHQVSTPNRHISPCLHPISSELVLTKN